MERREQERRRRVSEREKRHAMLAEVEQARRAREQAQRRAADAEQQTLGVRHLHHNGDHRHNVPADVIDEAKLLG